MLTHEDIQAFQEAPVPSQAPMNIVILAREIEASSAKTGTDGPVQIETNRDALNYLTNSYGWTDDEKCWTAFRAALRQELLAGVLLGENPSTVETEFNGSGDSGDVYSTNLNDNALDFFLERMVTKHVTIDWYNNEGGGGDISWDLQSDTVTINSYYNVTESVDDLVEAEF